MQNASNAQSTPRNASNARSTPRNTSNALRLQATQHAHATRNAANAQGGLVTQNASGAAASTPAIQPTMQPSDMQAALDRIAALEAQLEAARIPKKRGRPPGSKDKQPRKKKAQGTQQTSTEDV